MKLLSDIVPERSKSINTIGFLATILMSSVMLVPDLNGIATETIIFVTMFWIPGILSFHNIIPSRLKSILICLVAYFLVIFFYKILGISTAWWDISAGYYGCVACAAISCYSLYTFSNKQKMYTKWIIFGISVATMIYVSKKGLHDLSVMSVEEAISQENAAYGSSVMIFSSIVLLAFLYTKSKICKLLYLFAVLLSLYVTISIMQRGTNVVMTVILLSSILIFQFVHKIKFTKLIFTVIFIAAFLYYSGMFFEFLDYVSSVIPSERIAIRLKAINFFLQTGDALEAGSSMTTRTELMQRSIKSFTESIGSFFFGIGDHRGHGVPVGNHAEIIDTLARYGIFIFIILCAYFIKLIKWWFYILPSNSGLQYQVFSILLIYVARNIWGNAMTSAISILLFLYLPLIIIPIFKLSKKRI